MKFRPGDKIYYISANGEKVFREVKEVTGSTVKFTNGNWMHLDQCHLVELKKKGFAQWASDML